MSEPHVRALATDDDTSLSDELDSIDQVQTGNGQDRNEENVERVAQFRLPQEDDCNPCADIEERIQQVVCLQGFVQSVEKTVPCHNCSHPETGCVRSNLAEEFQVKTVVCQHAKIRVLCKTGENVADEQAYHKHQENVDAGGEPVDNRSDQREGYQGECIATQEPPFSIVSGGKSKEVGYEFPGRENGKPGVDEGFRTVGFLLREENKADGNENQEHLPVGEIKLFQFSHQVKLLAEIAFINAVAAIEKEHRNADLSEESDVGCGRDPENGEKVFQGGGESRRETPQVVHEHTADCYSLHDLGVILREITIEGNVAFFH